MYQNPTLFPAISNREGWLITVSIFDDDLDVPIALTDSNNNPLYGITLEITPASPRGHYGGYGNFVSAYYDDCGPVPSISATLANYISIVGVGVFQIAIPKSVMTTLRPQTYDVFLTIDPNNVDDGRQLLIGRLPVLYGGQNT